MQIFFFGPGVYHYYNYQEKEGRRLPQQLQMELMSFLTKVIVSAFSKLSSIIYLQYMSSTSSHLSSTSMFHLSPSQLGAKSDFSKQEVEQCIGLSKLSMYMICLYLDAFACWSLRHTIPLPKASPVIDLAGILRTNGMKLEEGGLSSSPGVVLYPAYCLINHACR